MMTAKDELRDLSERLHESDAREIINLIEDELPHLVHLTEPWPVEEVPEEVY
ncbi:MAG: hypothetical protein KGJ09_10545 [Candidatus Omnitrophica bacterium]|nr:hypothetical protein [Candidatus Omnitrophota bacterium]MDE2232452.1 hypothetical protein [Candidatus Omnitrophota bacterium]